MPTFTPLRFSLIMIFTLTFLGSAIAADIPKSPREVQRITITELQSLQSSGQTIVIIDTRTPGQWQQAKDKIPGAIRVTSRVELQKLQSEAPPETEIVTYCS